MGANEKYDATYRGGEYTPDTTRVRHAYVDHVEYSAQLHGLPSNDNGACEAFGRWLETVRAEAKAEALEEASYEIDQIDIDGDTALWIGPEQKYTLVSDWLRDRANQYKENQS